MFNKKSDVENLLIKENKRLKMENQELREMVESIDKYKEEYSELINKLHELKDEYIKKIEGFNSLESEYRNELEKLLK